MSWRTETPQLVQDDLDQLVSAALDAAQFLLEKNGEFYPFEIDLDEAGQTGMVAGDPGDGEHPDSRAVLELLYEAAAARRETLKAVAFVAEVEADGGDAVLVELEHRDGGPGIGVLMPYARSRPRGSLTYGELSAQPGERRVWPAG